jgi:hypothetical protein
MTTRLADAKGRIMLGSQFAGRMVLVDDSNPAQLILKPAIAIPAADAWLYQNEKALNLVREGLKQAQSGQFSKTPPDLGADAEFADAIAD